MSAQLDDHTDWDSSPAFWPQARAVSVHYVPPTEVKVSPRPWWTSGVKVLALINFLNFLGAMWLVLLDVHYNAGLMTIVLAGSAALSIVCAAGADPK